MIPVEKLQEIIELSEKATPGPWAREENPVCCEDCEGVSSLTIFGPEGDGFGRTAMAYAECGNEDELGPNADYIVTACNAAPDLARELIELRGKVSAYENDMPLQQACEENNRLREEAAQTCEWVQDYDGCWETSCGESFYFEEGGLSDNHCTYCHHCGKKIAETVYKSDDEETEASNE